MVDMPFAMALMGVAKLGVAVIGWAMGMFLVGVALMGEATSTIGTIYESLVLLYFWVFRMEPLEVLFTTVPPCFV